MLHVATCITKQPFKRLVHFQDLSFLPFRPPRTIAHPLRAEDVRVPQLPPLRRVGRARRGLPLHPLLQGEAGVSERERKREKRAGSEKCFGDDWGLGWKEGLTRTAVMKCAVRACEHRLRLRRRRAPGGRRIDGLFPEDQKS